MSAALFNTVIKPVLENDSPYISHAQFVSNQTIRQRFNEIAEQTKTDAGTAFALNKAFTLESLFNAKSKTPGYSLMNVHQHVIVFKPVGNSKSTPTEWMASAYEQSRAETLKFALNKKLINIDDIKKYQNYFKKSQNETDIIDSTNHFSLGQDDLDSSQAQTLIKSIINDIDENFKKLTCNVNTTDIENSKKILINYKDSTFIHPARPRKCWSDVDKRGGKAMLWDTEYGRTVTSINKEDNQAFELLWCVLADNEITPKDYSGTKYCVKKVPNNTTNCLLMGTMKDSLDFIQS